MSDLEAPAAVTAAPGQETAKPCALCGGSELPLRESHVLPAFVFRWLRESSGTGHIRFGENPNRRVQDGLKLSWLCSDCEARLGRSETAFATHIFHPLLRDSGLRVAYGDWLLRFCVSLSWRVLKYTDAMHSLAHFNSRQHALAGEALARWSAFLLERVIHPGIFEQHFLKWDGIESHEGSGLPNNFNRYIARSVEMDVAAVGDDSAVTYAKIGPFMVFGYIGTPNRRWRGSKIHVRNGTIQPERYELPEEILDYLKSRAMRYAALQEGISARQHEKIEKEVLANPERFKSSLTFQAMLNDERLFGTEAIVRRT